VLIELKSCPVCTGTELGPYLTVKDHSISGEIFHLSMCKSCGFKFTNPIPSEETIGKYYQSEDYISHSDTNKGIINKLYHLVRTQSLKSKLNLINKAVPNKGTLLDIGCGTGYFLQYCKENGWKTEGMEPDPAARSLAEKNTKQSIYTDLFSIKEEQKYDIITLWHVLEHVHKLNESIQHIHKLLKPNGVLIIAVPNCLSYDSITYGTFWAAYDVPRHLYHFTQPDMNKLLIKHNFTQTDLKPMVFDSFYVSMLSDKYKYGKTNYFRAFLNGFRSNMKASSNKNYSSLIYVFKKNG
jgi:2-polyprenyl-3-methyl-5-hydroxy-6-metoxy-1,4-benzoquinol methylase